MRFTRGDVRDHNRPSMVDAGHREPQTVSTTPKTGKVARSVRASMAGTVERGRERGGDLRGPRGVPLLGMGSFEEYRNVGGPRDGTLSRYLHFCFLREPWDEVRRCSGHYRMTRSGSSCAGPTKRIARRERNSTTLSLRAASNE
jgi:hypothetical protein